MNGNIYFFVAVCLWPLFAIWLMRSWTREFGHAMEGALWACCMAVALALLWPLVLAAGLLYVVARLAGWKEVTP